MVVDERLHRLKGRSSSAWAKYADALRRISLTWRSLFKKTFRVVKPIKPKASRYRSSETFLVGVGLKNPGVLAEKPS